MTRTRANSARAGAALTLVEDLQRRFVSQLEVVADAVGDPTRLQPVEWLRDDGRHGGGVRFVAGSDKGSQVFNRASVNVSQVHYDDLPNKRLGSATALSCIIHPANPHASSMHMHISWTELRDGGGTWRVMADLNPAIAETAPAAAFEACLREAAGGQWDHGRAQGDRYFAIPALDRHRGVVHFYLEGFATDDEAADRAFAERVGQQVIATYCDTLRASILAHPAPTAEDRDQQLAYHTVYLFQVLTLDRGTTSGLLVHDQNDV
ncbi:MAG: coproporphyrinogen III oxidase, partial [Myxococcota bacterium]